MNRYWNILSIKNRHKVKQDVQKLHHLNNFASIAIALVLRSGKSAWISSSPKIALHTEVTGLSRGDLLLSPSFFNGKNIIKADDLIEIDEIQKNINHIIEKNGIYRCYNIIRSCDDCSIIISYNTKNKIKNIKSIYEETKDEVLLFSMDFINYFINDYASKLPELKITRFYSDYKYRNSIIKNTNSNSEIPLLTSKESLILYWTAKGKTAEEISIITNLKKNTVDSYRRNIIYKLNVKNITQAIYMLYISNKII